MTLSPVTRKSHRRSLDMIGGLDAAGRRMAGGANERLERAPIRVPARFLIAGAVMLAGAFALGTLSGEMGPGTRAYEVAWMSATVLYACGGLSILVGLAGLLSALVVHIVGKKGRRL